ncbi:hypothetical protein ACTXT7_016309 [Hymenolepis weldensis]
MADLPHTVRITMLLRNFSSSDRDLNPSYLQPMDPTDLTYANTISKLGSVVGDNSSLFIRHYRCFNVAMREDENAHRYYNLVLSTLVFFHLDGGRLPNADSSKSELL